MANVGADTERVPINLFNVWGHKCKQNARVGIELFGA